MIICIILQNLCWRVKKNKHLLLINNIAILQQCRAIFIYQIIHRIITYQGLTQKNYLWLREFTTCKLLEFGRGIWGNIMVYLPSSNYSHWIIIYHQSIRFYDLHIFKSYCYLYLFKPNLYIKLASLFLLSCFNTSNFSPWPRILQFGVFLVFFCCRCFGFGFLCIFVLFCLFVL